MRVRTAPWRTASALLAILTLAASPVASVDGAKARYLDPQTFVPALLLPSPPAPGSAEERRELAEVHAIMAAASPRDRAMTKADDLNETPSLFDQALAPGVSLHALPRTWTLLTRVADEADAVASRAKRRFDRVRPWGVDPTIIPCDAAPGRKPVFSYPSGHAMIGYSVGLVLARLMPDRAPAILARARRYAFERVICGAHFPSDIEASHVLAAILVARLDTVPAFRTDLARAMAELHSVPPHSPGS